MPIAAAPWEALAAFGFILLGLPLYYLTASSRSAVSSGPPTSFGRTGDATLWERVQDVFRGRDVQPGVGVDGSGNGEGREEMVEMLGRRGGGS